MTSLSRRPSLIAVDQPLNSGWLSGPRFDSSFIGGSAAVAVLAGAAVSAHPPLFLPVLVLSLWMLVFHHGISTVTDIAVEPEIFRTRRIPVVALPVLAASAAAALAAGFGFWVIATICLYWHWVQYGRQSWAVARIYERKAYGRTVTNAIQGQITMFLLPLWGILYSLSHDPALFLGLELRVIPVASIVADSVGLAAIGSVLWWAWTRMRLWEEGALPVGPSLYIASHFAVFAAAYLLIEDIGHSWLTITVWYNVQHMMLAWLVNDRRTGSAKTAPDFVATLGGARGVAAYMLAGAAIAATAYFGAPQAVWIVPALLVIYLAISGQRYFMDSITGKFRGKAVPGLHDPAA